MKVTVTLLAASAMLCVAASAVTAQSNAPAPNGFHDRGVITFVDPDRGRIGVRDSAGSTFTIDTTQTTVNLPGDSAAAAGASDLVAGMQVSIDGNYGGNGLIDASSVNVLPYTAAPSTPVFRPGDYATMRGTVQQISGTTLVVQFGDTTRQVTIQPATLLNYYDGNPMRESDISVGDTVRVNGAIGSGGTLYASQVMLDNNQTAEPTPGRFFHMVMPLGTKATIHGVLVHKPGTPWSWSRGIRVATNGQVINVHVPHSAMVEVANTPTSMYHLPSNGEITVDGVWESDGTLRADSIRAWRP